MGSDSQLRSRLSVRTRMALLLAAAIWGSVGVVAWGLVPEERGWGTHRQLGLGDCAFRVLTSYGCPMCGMTTSVTWAIHGHWKRSVLVHPAGAVLVVVSGPAIMGMIAMAVRGRTWPSRRSRLDPWWPVWATLALVAAISLLAWILRAPLGRFQG